MINKITYILLLTTFFSFGTTTKVKRVIDGDTFETETGEKVRLIGINAPEISDIFGQEAKEYLSDLILNKTVDLQCDNISNDKDRYKRLLRYVILDRVDINKKMISDGFAFAYLKYHFSNSKDYEQAQIQSQLTNRGIWGGNTKPKHIDSIENIDRLTQYFSVKAFLIIFLSSTLFIIGIYYYCKK